jgi:3-hydroxyisobutyrate dehydrogenase
MSTSGSTTVGFVGLGVMGSHMAANLAAGPLPTRVWDLSTAAIDTAASAGCEAVGSPEDLAGSEVLFTSLPRSVDVEALADRLIAGASLTPGTIWVDTTSGVPDVSKRVNAKLLAEGVHFLDCGVAGGPAGAKSGKLAAMVGGCPDQLAAALPVMGHLMGKIVHIGPAGAGHAVKSVNNTMLAAHIWVAYEGLVTLAKLDVPMEQALAAINAASGRSLVTEERIPNHVLSREFDFGFALDLMRKDIGITMDTLTALDIPAPVLRQVSEMFAMGEAKLGPKAEHMEVLKVLEEMAGVELKASHRR